MFYLQRNLPGWERALRLALAALVTGATWAVLAGSWLMWLAAAAAATLALTAIVGFCPACALAGRRPLSRRAP